MLARASFDTIPPSTLHQEINAMEKKTEVNGKSPNPCSSSVHSERQFRKLTQRE